MSFKLQIPNSTRGGAERSEAKLQIANSKSQITNSKFHPRRSRTERS